MPIHTHIRREFHGGHGTAAGGGTTFGNSSRDFASASSQYVQLGAASAVDRITIAAWVKYLDTTSTADFPVFTAGRYYDASSSFGLEIRVTGGNRRVQFAVSNTRGLIHNATPFTGWEHVAIVYDSVAQTVELFRDGVSASTSSFGTAWDSLAVGSYDKRIGGRGVTSAYANGGIADVREYHRALSSSEIADLAAGTDVPTGLDGWWITDADDVLDYAGSDDGTNNGTTYSTDGPLD